MENTTSPSIAEPVPEMQTPQPTRPSLPTLPIKKILVAIGAFLLICVLAFAGYWFLKNRSQKSDTGTTVRPITLTYWGMMEDSESFKSVRKQFETDHPGVSIQYSQQSPKDYSERLISACTRGQCPDLFRFHSTWAPQYTDRGLLAAMPATVFAAGEYESTFYPVVASDLKTSKGYVGIPLMFDGLGLYINKRILQASGKSAPTTWDELRSLAQELTIKGADNSIERSGVAMGTANNVDHFSDIIATLIYQNGGDPLKPENFASPNQSATGPGTAPASLVGDALTFYTQFARTDKIWNDTMPNSTYAFAIERTAMILAPAYRAAEIKKINPNFEFSVYPLPQLPGKPVTYANYWAEGVSKTSPEQEMAWTFLKYLSSKDVLAKLNPIGDGKLLKEVYSRADMASLIANDPYAGAIVAQASTARSSNLASRTFDKGLDDKLVELYADAVTKMAGGARYDEIGLKLAPAVQQLVQTYKVQVGAR